MKPTLTKRLNLVDLSFSLAVLIWIVSLASLASPASYLIAPFALPLFILSLVGHFNWRRAALAAMSAGWTAWILWVGLV